MPTKRVRRARERSGITPEAVTAWQQGDCDALREALGLKPWHILPWPLRLTALGCDPRHPPPPDTDRP
jgi:hypothetical protein